MRPLAVASLLLAACQGGLDDTATTTSTSTTFSTTTTVSVGTTAPTASEPTTIDEPTTATASEATSDVTTSGPTATTEPADSSSTGDSSTGDEPVEPPAIRYIGRRDDSDPLQVRMSWSGVGAMLRFDGTEVVAQLGDPGNNHFTVVVDGEVTQDLLTSPGENAYTLATGLPPGPHTVELYRRTEGSLGATTILALEHDGALLPLDPVARRMEIVGDSITCGYGNEGQAPCSFTPATENHYNTYGAITARALGAELHTVAWSGKGVVNNYDDDVFEPLPQIYDRTIATDGATTWDHARWQPDVVVVNLGTNDFSTDGDPPEAVFVPAYGAFLTHIREVNPDAFILIVAPLLFGQEATMVAGYLQSVVDQRHAEGDPNVAFTDINVNPIGSGCDGHPSVATHEAMSAKLVAALEMHVGW